MIKFNSVYENIQMDDLVIVQALAPLLSSGDVWDNVNHFRISRFLQSSCEQLLTWRSKMK